MLIHTAPFPTMEVIRGTFEMMLREWGHRATAIRFTCRDLGVPPHTVLDAVARAEAEPSRPPRGH